ncbi:hypothetical protein PUN28_019118 [Cardiocondyla obscurior]|uniref:Uncharacterized protein n=1 Tax=Cardiocondyla obscurior TaxID=286306 RepID=A0AAW2EDI2_9HYME
MLYTHVYVLNLIFFTEKLELTIPSRSIVARICSDPGVTLNADFAFKPCFKACLAMLAHRPISSYELLVQEPIRPTLISFGQPFFLAVSPVAIAKIDILVETEIKEVKLSRFSPTCSLQKAINFLIYVFGTCQIFLATDLSLNQVIAMNGGGNCDFCGRFNLKRHRNVCNRTYFIIMSQLFLRKLTICKLITYKCIKKFSLKYAICSLFSSIYLRICRYKCIQIKSILQITPDNESASW